MEEVFIEALKRLRCGERLAFLTLLACQGSTPRDTGAFMILTEAGRTLGSVGGGLLEAQALAAARESLEQAEDRIIQIELTGDSVEGNVPICGGRATVLVHSLSPGDEDAIDALSDLESASQAGTRGWLCITVPESLGQGGIVHSFMKSEDLSDEGLGPRQQALEASKSSVEGFALEELPDRALFLAYFVGRLDRALVFGAGHVGKALVPALKAVGFRVTALDDRPELLTAEALPLADETVVLPGSYRPAFAGISVDHDTYVVIVTRGHAYDKAVLEQALRTDAGYVGMMSSKAKLSKIVQALAGEGYSVEELARLHSPIGLSIGAETPAELAVSIAAELIQQRALLRSRASSGS